MIKKALTTVFLVMAFATFCFAQDISGNWKGTINDQFEVHYTFKVDGEKLTGSSKAPDGTDRVISDGVIKGDDFSFNMNIRGNPTKVTGKIKGEVITLSFSINDNDVKVDLTKDK
ncbi:MAG: hypothetical protein ABI203_07165 [Mucilaginibacter sp.]